MQDVSRDILRQLEDECVVVTTVDPKASAKGQHLQETSARYESGYWVIKMYIWKLLEYEKVGHVPFIRSAIRYWLSEWMHLGPSPPGFLPSVVEVDQ
jgi:hypothetical protein